MAMALGAKRLFDRQLGDIRRDPPRETKPLQSSDACNATAQTSMRARWNVTRIKPAAEGGLAQSVLTTMEFFRIGFESFASQYGQN
jgi:hypothetical protein